MVFILRVRDVCARSIFISAVSIYHVVSINNLLRMLRRSCACAHIPWHALGLRCGESGANLLLCVEHPWTFVRCIQNSIYRLLPTVKRARVYCANLANIFQCKRTISPYCTGVCVWAVSCAADSQFVPSLLSLISHGNERIKTYPFNFCLD